MSFAIGNPGKEEAIGTYSVLFVIDFSGSEQFFYLNSCDVSAYPNEKEVLLQDGIKYEVTGFDEATEVVESNGKEVEKQIKIIKLMNKVDCFKRSNACMGHLRMLVFE